MRESIPFLWLRSVRLRPDPQEERRLRSIRAVTGGNPAGKPDQEERWRAIDLLLFLWGRLQPACTAAILCTLFIPGAQAQEPYALPRTAQFDLTAKNGDAYRMIDNARELSWRLAALESAGLSTGFRLFPGETHGSVALPVLAHAIPFAFRAATP